MARLIIGLLLLASCGDGIATPVDEVQLALIGPGSYPEDQRPPGITENRWFSIREQSYLAALYATSEKYFEAQRFGIEHLPVSSGRDFDMAQMVRERDEAAALKRVAERALFELQQ